MKKLIIDINRVILTGRLTNEPKTSFTKAGKVMTTFAIAVNQVVYRQGEKEEHTNFFKIDTWNKIAEVCGEYLSKGDRVLIDGALRSSSWEDDNQVKRYRTTVTARQVLFLSPKKADKNSSEANEIDEDVKETLEEIIDAEDIPF